MKESKSSKASNKKKKSNILVGVYLDQIKHEEHLNRCLLGLANQVHKIDVVILDAGLSNKELATLKKIAKNPTVKVTSTDEEGNAVQDTIKANGKLNMEIVKTSVSNFSKVFNDLFNMGREKGYEAISIVEVEDAVGPNWYWNASDYMEENEEVGFFLPLIKNWQNGGFSGLMNEAAWAEGMAEEAGKFDMNLLLRFNCANPLGGVYRISDLEEYSEERDGRYYPMKESVKVSHYYEFFLRMVYNDIKMMSVPRIGYDFRVQDVEEFSHSSSKVPNNITAIPIEKGGISPDEASFWMELAKKEYFFDEDRNKVYEQQPQKA